MGFMSSLGGSALIGGGSSILGSALNNAFSISAMQRNQRYAREQMAWEENMSNSAHQREVADLRAAGLNPILSATGGNGASTPSGQSGSIAQAQADSDLSSARELYKYLDSQADNVKADTQQKREAAKTEQKTQKLIEQQTHESSSRTGLNNNEYNYQMMTMPGLADTLNSSNAVKRLENEVLREKYETEKSFYHSPFGAGVQAAGMALNSLAPAINAASTLSRMSVPPKEVWSHGFNDPQTGVFNKKTHYK